MKRELKDKRTCEHWWVKRYGDLNRPDYWECEYCGISKEEWGMNTEREEKLVMA